MCAQKFVCTDMDGCKCLSGQGMLIVGNRVLRDSKMARNGLKSDGLGQKSRVLVRFLQEWVSF